jgi:membrane protein YqaA with SNARE-associated domain
MTARVKFVPHKWNCKIEPKRVKYIGGFIWVSFISVIGMFDSNQPETTYNMLSSAVEKRRDWKLIVQRVVALVFAITITVVLYLLRDTIKSYAIYGYPGVFVISALGNATLILPAPSFAIVLVLAGTLNPFWMGIAAGCGAALGEMTGYLAGFGGRGVVEEKPIYKRLAVLMRKRGAWIIFLLALIPNPFFDVGGIMAGMLKMPWWKFFAAAAAGKSIRFIILALLGESFF